MRLYDLNEEGFHLQVPHEHHDFNGRQPRALARSTHKCAALLPSTLRVVASTPSIGYELLNGPHRNG